MQVSRVWAVLIGLLTLWPFAWFAAFFVTVFALIAQVPRTPPGPGAQPPALLAYFPLLFVAHGVTMLVCAGLLVFYIAHVFKNRTLAEDRRVLWTIIIFLGNIGAMPFYWYLHVWRPLGAVPGDDV